MSTASPLPLEPEPSLRREVAQRLETHRKRRSAGAFTQDALPGMESMLVYQESNGPRKRSSSIADSVAARFAKSPTYQDFLARQAETAMLEATAAAEVARRNAEAIVHAQQCLLDEIDHWNRSGETQPAGEVIAFANAQERQAQPVDALPQEALPGRADTPLLHTSPGMQPGQFDGDLHVELQDVNVAPEPIPANLIEFPRQLIAARKARPRFAEGPLRDEADSTPERAQLRIFEVEASAFSTQPQSEPAAVLPEWSSIRLDTWHPPAANTSHTDTPFVPIYIAPLRLRCMAAVVDACCIGSAFLVAVGAAALNSSVLPEGLDAALSAAVTLAFFTAAYMLLFFSLSDSTPGMRYARIGLCTFSDENPTRSAMRLRLIGSLLAALPFGLGFMWSCLDENRLGLHDRLSRMYQRAY